MDKKTFVGWIVVTVLLSSVISFAIGEGVAAQHVDQVTVPLANSAIEDWKQATVQEQALLEKTNAEWKKTINALNECNAQYSQGTVLVTTAGGSFAVNISPLTGHFGLSNQGDVRNAWVIPQRLNRVMTLSEPGTAFFYYADLRTGKLDGPYIPLRATAKLWAESTQ